MPGDLGRERIAAFLKVHFGEPEGGWRDETVLSASGRNIEELLKWCKTTYRPKQRMVIDNIQTLTFGELVTKLNN